MKMAGSKIFWQSVAEAFARNAAEYDRWYENNPLFEIELEAINALNTQLTAPVCEVGVGTGRFAHALAIPLGVDPAMASLIWAKNRGIQVCRAIAEKLPFRSKSIGTLLMLFTLDFIENPSLVLQECHRVLADQGNLVLGTISAASSWGKMLAGKKEKGNPLYRFITLYTPETIISLLEKEGFSLKETRSTLFQHPDKVIPTEKSCAGVCDEAGFILYVGGKYGEAGNCQAYGYSRKHQ